MQRVALGGTGEKVSQMCLGTMMFGYRADETESGRIVNAALDRGVNFIDTASMYCEGATEEILGRILQGRRDKVFMVTKVNVGEGADYPEQIPLSLDASLKRLQMDHVDLFLIHWARKGMDPQAMMRALGAAVKSGKTRYVGCSNFPAWLVAHFNAAAAAEGLPRLVNNQVPYNLIERGIEMELLPYADATGLAITCYRPLMAGILAGKYQPGATMPEDARAQTDERIPKWAEEHEAGVRALLNMARSHDVPPIHLSIAWLRSQRGVTSPIIGVSRLDQFTEACDAFEFDLPEEQCNDLAAAFGCEVKEVSQFYGPLRRSFELV